MDERIEMNLENNKKEDNTKNYEYFEMGRKISSSNETTFEDESRTKVTGVHVRCDKDVVHRDSIKSTENFRRKKRPARNKRTRRTTT